MEQREDAFIELQESLMNDSSGMVKKELEEYLMEWRAQVKRQIDAGLPPDEFARFESIYEALSKALDVLGRAWSTFHG